MERGRRSLLALWIAANAAVLAFLVVDPQVTRSSCDGRWIDNPVDWIRSNDDLGHDLCGVETAPLAGRGAVVAGAVVANGVALGCLGNRRSRRIPVAESAR